MNSCPTESNIVERPNSKAPGFNTVEGITFKYLDDGTEQSKHLLHDSLLILGRPHPSIGGCFTPDLDVFNVTFIQEGQITDDERIHILRVLDLVVRRNDLNLIVC